MAGTTSHDDPTRLRPYQPEDLDDVLLAWEQASRLAHPFLHEDFLAQERRNIAEVYLPAARTWVAVRAGRVLGFLSLVDNEVGGLFVHPEAHGQRLGYRLMEKARQEQATLELEVFEANALGRRFYDRYGFEVVGRSIHGATQQPVLRLRYRNAA